MSSLNDLILRGRAEAAHQPPVRVLLAEESERTRSRIARVMRLRGWNVIEVEDGLEIEDYLEVADGGRGPVAMPDVIVATAQMSGSGALEALERLRGAGSSIPFIVLNSEAEAQVTVRARSAGAAGVVEGVAGPRTLCEMVTQAMTPAWRSPFFVRDWRTKAFDEPLSLANVS